jgi:hypothetical protein
MRNGFLLLVFLVISTPAPAQTIVPGEWEITSISTSRFHPKPHSSTFKRCVHKEDAENPERWAARESAKAECTFNPGVTIGETVHWELVCPKTNVRGSGSATLRGTTMQSEMQVRTEIHGQSFEMTTRLSGRRIGACQS